MAELRDTTSYGINDFIAWDERKELNLSPKYQRNPVWDNKAKSYLIDTILRGLIIPPIFFRQTLDLSLGKTYKEIIDGQQRLRAIFEFKKGLFKILPEHNKEYGGLRFEQLPNDAKTAFFSYRFPVEIIKTEDEGLIYDIFARLNSSSMTVNRQELRNAKFWGYFKVLAYRLAKKCKELFIYLKTFTDKKLARMEDVEFISSLIILVIDGIITEKKDTIDEYYKNYDSKFDNIEKVEEKFIQIINVIRKIYYEENLSKDVFNAKTPLYNLFAIICHFLYGAKHLDENLRIDIFKESSIFKNINILSVFLSDFEADYERYKSNLIPKDDTHFELFKKYHELKANRTTDQNERIERITLIINYIQDKING
jgi:hypothetical protein